MCVFIWHRLALFSSLLVVCMTREAAAVKCGTGTPDEKFNAVCGLAHADWETNAPTENATYGQGWYPNGSGTLVEYEDSSNVTRRVIVTVKHVVDNFGVAWNAYFRHCETYPNPNPFACPEGLDCEFFGDNIVRVRITGFTIASGSFGPPTVQDPVMVAHIHEDDLDCIAHIPARRVYSPVELGLCRDQPIYLAGWGETLDAGCALQQAQRLHVAASTMTAINCDTTGRNGLIMSSAGSCVPNGSCIPTVGNHDSGGAMAIEMSDGSLGLIGAICCGDGSAYLASRHQFFANPQASEYLCTPCRPRACVDVTRRNQAPPPNGVNPDGFESEHDRDWLDDWGPHAVNCGCMGDLNHNGCAGDDEDIALIDPQVQLACAKNKGCYGDTNADGDVNAADLLLIGALLEANNNQSITCSECSTCVAALEWCPGDINCDGQINWTDYNTLDVLLQSVPSGSFSCLWNAPGCTATANCP